MFIPEIGLGGLFVDEGDGLGEFTVEGLASD